MELLATVHKDTGSGFGVGTELDRVHGKASVLAVSKAAIRTSLDGLGSGHIPVLRNGKPGHGPQADILTSP